MWALIELQLGLEELQVATRGLYNLGNDFSEYVEDITHGYLTSVVIVVQN